MLLKTRSLSPVILNIVRDKGTERPFSGEYENNTNAGTYLCRQCGLALFRASCQFASSCGWPSFDDEIQNTVSKQPDVDGDRTEITCTRCKAHLGHVFYQEGLTEKNVRYCVNSLSIDFVSSVTVKDSEEAILAAGCFWGVEYYFERLSGVLKTEVGYIGGKTDRPTYEAVCSGATGHYEAIRVVYDPSLLTYEQIVQYFFEIHDPTQIDGQGPDRASQYLSRIFYYTESQQQTSLKLIQQLINKGYAVVTKVLPMAIFWRGEDYHQHYYDKHHKEPYCHRYEKKF
jgi:peptide methionine sulfoxide reductase msrA/msrB